MTTLLRTALLASILLLSGCLRSTTTVRVDDSGGGEATVILAVDPARTAELAAETGGLAATTLSDTNTAQLCEQFRQLALPSDLPPTATVVDYDADGLCGHQIDFTFVDGDELARTLDRATGGQAGDLESFVLAPEGDDWVFAAPLGGLNSALQSAASSFPPAVVQTALDNTAVSYELTLPGSAVEGANNADEVDGATFRWNVDAANPPEVLMARSTVDGGGLGGPGLLLWALVGLALVAAIGGGAVLLSRRGGGDALVPATDGGSFPPPAAPAAGAAPPPDLGFPAPDVDPGAQATAFAPTGTPEVDAATVAAEEPMDMAGAEPRWDPERRAWVADHETEGLLVHDEATGQWRRA